MTIQQAIDLTKLNPDQSKLFSDLLDVVEKYSLPPLEYMKVISLLNLISIEVYDPQEDNQKEKKCH